MSDSNIETEGQASYDENAARGQPGQPAQPAAGQESITDLLTKPLTQAYVKAIVALYGLLGAGMGLVVLLAGIVDQPIFDHSRDGNTIIELGSPLADFPIAGAPYIAAVLALFVGGYLGIRMAADDRQTMLTGAAGALAGTIVLWILSAFLAVSQVDEVDLDFGGLIVNTVVLGLVVGGIAAGTVYVMRNLVPDVDESAV